MPFYTVHHLGKKEEYLYGPMDSPKQALVCAFEQYGRKNFNTWQYKDPSQYAIQEGKHHYLLGDFSVKKEEASE